MNYLMSDLVSGFLIFVLSVCLAIFVVALIPLIILLFLLALFLVALNIALRFAWDNIYIIAIGLLAYYLITYGV